MMIRRRNTRRMTTKLRRRTRFVDGHQRDVVVCRLNVVLHQLNVKTRFQRHGEGIRAHERIVIHREIGTNYHVDVPEPRNGGLLVRNRRRGIVRAKVETMYDHETIKIKMYQEMIERISLLARNGMRIGWNDERMIE